MQHCNFQQNVSLSVRLLQPVSWPSIAMLWNLLAKQNSSLRYQIEHVKKDKYHTFTKIVQNGITDTMAQIFRNSFFKNIKESKYYTVMFGCAPDVQPNTAQMYS